MKLVSQRIDGYAFGAPEVLTSPVSMKELEDLKASVGFTEEDQRYLQMAGMYLQVRPNKWLIIGGAESSPVYRTFAYPTRAAPTTRCLSRTSTAMETWTFLT